MNNSNLNSVLKTGEVHLWLVTLDHVSLNNREWENNLSAEEVARSQRYISPMDRQLFTARRGILRLLLGQYHGMHPASIRYHTNPYGKLSIFSSPISFNLSKSLNRVACVFTLEGEAGIDIEQIRMHADLPSLAKQFFSQGEQAAMCGLAPEVQVDAFYHTWTQKEAFIKAMGKGLNLPLNDFSVSVDPAKPGSLLSIKGSQEQLSNCKMICTIPTPGWRAAVCVQTKREIDLVLFKPDVGDFMTSASSGIMSHSV
jgi:4'-phosphopantetheinyl transferase